MVNELPKDWKRHHEFWSNEKSYKELDDILNKIANSIDKRRNHKDWEEAQDDIRYARGRWNRVKKDMKESRQRKSLNEGLTLSEDDFYGSRKDLLDAYLEWNGIVGYTQQIWDIIETGEAYFRDMDEDDLKDLKRRFGIYESKKKPMGRRLRESRSEEIDRKIFGSLIKYNDFVGDKSYAVLNDGNFCYKFMADSDEEAKEIFRKFGTKAKTDGQGWLIKENLTEGKLVEPFQEDIEFFENYITDVIGYAIEAKGRTLMGNKHYQIRSLFQDADRSDLLELVKGLNKLDELMEKREIPMTYNAGIDDHGYVTAGLDLNKKYVPDETDEPLEHSRRYTKLFVDNTDESLNEAANDYPTNPNKLKARLQDINKAIELGEDPEHFAYEKKKIFDQLDSLGSNYYDESLVESRQLNEGAGAGYTISGKVGDVRINNITITEDETTDTTIYYGVEGDIELDLTDVRCESYYYGGTIPKTTAKVEWLGLSAEKSWELPAPTEEDVFELLINMDFSTTYGGGWSHSSFGNDLEMDYNDINYSSATYDVDKLEIKFTDPKAVDAIDKYATGENYDVEFSVLDKDKYEVEYFDNLDDAIAYAKEENQPFVAETHWGWEYLGNDEYDTTDRVDSSEVVWKNEDLEVED